MEQLLSILSLLYLLTFVSLCLFGFHRARLVYLIWANRRRIAGIAQAIPVQEPELPKVTIQLPIYNEATVVARLLEAVGRLDYPRDRLQIQVLDDSTDETLTISSAKVEELRARGLDIALVRRPDRVGYKAGALDYGLKRATGEFIAIFDADFIPQRSFLKSTIGNFRDPEVAVVQTRWEHLNRDLSLLTSVQALMLDGHHLVENRARFGAGFVWNFSGTGGIWRKSAIEDAGGWQHDTVTEDLDLSYRAQMRGWRFVYRPDVLTPSELPEELSALRAQQFRWAKGTVQTCRKLLKKVLTGPLTTAQKVEAFFHLTPHFAYPLIVALTVLLLPTVAYMPASDWRGILLVDLPITVFTSGSLALFYGVANLAQGRSLTSALVRLPALIALNAGLAPHQTRAVFEGLRSMSGEFVRTPKKGNSAGRYFMSAGIPFVELCLAGTCAVTAVTAFRTGHYFAAPFAAVFMAGYLYVAYLLMAEQAVRRRIERVSRPVPEAVETMARAA